MIFFRKLKMGNSDNETKKKKKGGDSDEEEKKLALKEFRINTMS